MILVFSDTVKTSDAYIQQHKELGLFRKTDKIRSAHRLSHFIGYHDVEVHLVGRYKLHEDWPMICDQIRSRGYKVKEVPEWR